MTTASEIADRLAAVRTRVASAAVAAGRAADAITLLGAAKAQADSAVRSAVEAGLAVIGENYLDDGLRHQAAIGRDAVTWHFIGPVQSNKTRDIAAHFDCVQTLDREKIARRLNEQRPDHLRALDVLVQVNISAEATKAGIAPDAIPEFCRVVASFPQLRLRGLMAIPAPDDLGAAARLNQHLADLQGTHPEANILSVGMSSDLESAIAAGSTLVRVGTDLFGPRANPKHTKEFA